MASDYYSQKAKKISTHTKESKLPFHLLYKVNDSFQITMHFFARFSVESQEVLSKLIDFFHLIFWGLFGMF